ncbi:MAG: hypothetical protein ABW352_11635, partial [Polyangiales bacterium]
GPSVDSRADLYAVGVVAYEMMSGRTAFEGETTGDVVASVLHTRPVSLRKVRDVHEALEAWVERAMSPRRSDRYQSARQMREALREAWEQHLDQVGARGQRRWGKRVRVVGALGLVAVGMMLPVPSSYDTGIGRLLGRTGSSADPASAAAPVLLEAAAAVAAPQPAAAEQPRQRDVGESEWDLAQAVEASAQAIAATEASKGSQPVEAQPPAHVTLGTNGAAMMGKRPQAAMMARPGFAPAPAAPGAKPQQGPAAMQKRVFGAQQTQGVLLNDYVQKLETLTGPAPAPRAPSNPYDKIPDNPYGD